MRLQAVNRVVVVPVRRAWADEKSGLTVLEIPFSPSRRWGKTRNGIGVSTKLVHAQLSISPGSGEVPHAC